MYVDPFTPHAVHDHPIQPTLFSSHLLGVALAVHTHMLQRMRERARVRVALMCRADLRVLDALDAARPARARDEPPARRAAPRRPRQ
eukprot:2643346-Prymnesium_polylepis.1